MNDAGSPWDRKATLALALVTLLALALFWRSREGGFLCWDDRGYVSENAQLHPISWQEVRDQSGAYVMGNWHPLTMLSYALDLRVAGMDARHMHTVNLFLHLANLLLICLLAWKLSGDARVAVITALLWGISPWRVEPVAWISARKELLMTFFAVLTLIAYLRYATDRRWPPLALAFIAFCLACMCKATAVAVVPCLLLIDAYTGRSLKERAPWLEKLPFFLVALVVGIAAQRAQAAEAAFDDLSVFGFGERMVIAGASLVRYALGSIAPVGLANFHPYPASGSPDPLDFLLLFVLPVLVYALWRWRSQRAAWFGAVFLLLNVALVLQLIPVGMAVRADRYTYLGGFGIAFAVASMGMAWWRSAARGSRWLPTALLLVLVAWYGTATFLKVPAWKDCLSFWDDQLQRTPELAVGLTNRAEAFWDLGDHKRSLADLNKAVHFAPRNGGIRMNRALLLTGMGRYDEALKDFTLALRIAPTMTPVLQANIGYTLNKMGRHAETEAIANHALAVDSLNIIALRNRGRARALLGKPVEARADLERSIALQPRNAEAHYYLGLLLSDQGDASTACVELRTALAQSLIDPDFHRDAQQRIANCR